MEDFAVGVNLGPVPEVLRSVGSSKRLPGKLHLPSKKVSRRVSAKLQGSSRRLQEKVQSKSSGRQLPVEIEGSRRISSILLDVFQTLQWCFGKLDV